MKTDQRYSTFLAVVAFWLSACSVGPDYTPPQMSLAPKFTEGSVAPFLDEEVSLSWWKSFSDEQLSSLIEKTVQGNRSVEAALARVNQARALRQESFLDFFPTVTSKAGYVSQRQSAARLNGYPAPRNLDLYNAGLDASWEIDLFGRVRRGYEQQSAQEEARVAELGDALRVVVAESASTYLELRGVQAEHAVALENAASQEKTFKLTTALKDAGQGTALDVARSEAQYKSTLAAIPLLEARIKGALFRLAVLCGQEPGAIESELAVTKPLPVYSGPIALGAPAELLSRRPDVRAAERALAARTAGIGVAVGDYFPKLTFEGSLGMDAKTPRDFGSGVAEGWAFGPHLSWAAFNMGRVYANVKYADAQTAEAMANYQQVVLTALEETNNALVRFGTERRRLEFLREAEAAAVRAFQIAELQYRQGAIDFLSVLEAQRQMLLTQVELAHSETTLATDLVGIFRALGGGWQEVGVVEKRARSTLFLHHVAAIDNSTKG